MFDPVDRSPCRFCTSREKCKAEIACFDFWYFTETGRSVHKNRVATKAIFDLVFANDGFDPDISTDVDEFDDLESLQAWEDFSTALKIKEK